MGTKATRKDFYMEIRSSLGRFLSIFFIVALGVAFFAGIRAAEPDMRITADAYFDDAKLMDIRTISTLGITDKDIAAIEKVEGVGEVEGGYSADFLCEAGDRQIAVHVMSRLPSMNQSAVVKGRLPEKSGECMADEEMGYKLGDKIKLQSGSEDPVTDTLSTDELTVVGIGNSPCYLAFDRGSTTIGTGKLSGFLEVSADTFDMEVYSEAYVRVEGAGKLQAYTDAYDDRVEEVRDHIEDITGQRGVIRKRELVDDADKELDQAKKELADGKAKADKELGDAAKKLADGEQQLSDAKAQIADGRQQIADAKATLVSKQGELDSAKSQYEEGKQKSEEGWAQYEQGAAQLEEQRAQMTEIGENLTQWKSGLDQLQGGITQLQQQIEEIQGQIDSLGAQAAQLEAQIQALEAIEERTPEQEAQLEALRQGLAEVQGGQAQCEEALPELQPQLEGLQAQLAQMEADGKGQSDYEAAYAQLQEGEAQLADPEQQLAKSKAELDAGEAGLSDAWAQIESGQSQIDAGWSELNTQEATLNDGAAQLPDKEKELADGKKEYEKGKADADQKLADGEKKIADAEKEIREIKNPKWYVNDRSALPENSGYGDNADRMRAIGEVFPVLFFLVAALISLTSMTRMVEEQRTEIGTMKALGYNKGTIAAKYLGYAFLATMGGSLFGVVVGEKVLPYIIIYSYEIMYRHLPAILVPYNMFYATAATLAALACTMGATVVACFAELHAQPAVLMRPPAPKKGKRVFLERVTMIWKHLSFIWKSTIRNLMRYKKRFFMTIFGIGGCMALMLVGFGLRDSILAIPDLQYGQIQTYDGMAHLEEDVSEEQRKAVDAYLDGAANLDQYIQVNMKNVTLTNGENEQDAYETVPETMQGLDEFIHFRDRRSHETYQLSEEGAIISEKTAKMLEAKVGDTITIKDEEDGDKTVKIADICENYMGHYIYISPGQYQKIYGEKPSCNSIYFQAKDISGNKLESLGEKLLEQDGVVSISYVRDTQKQLNDMLKSLDLVMIVLIVSAGMLAFVVLYNLNNINITERQRELATIKVLGFYDPEVAAYVYRENVLLTLIGSIVGMGLGRILHLFVIQTVEVDAAMFGRNLNFPSYIYSFLFTLAFSAFVNWVMYFKLKRIDMVESLKSIE